MLFISCRNTYLLQWCLWNCKTRKQHDFILFARPVCRENNTITFALEFCPLCSAFKTLRWFGLAHIHIPKVCLHKGEADRNKIANCSSTKSEIDWFPSRTICGFILLRRTCGCLLWETTWARETLENKTSYILHNPVLSCKGRRHRKMFTLLLTALFEASHSATFVSFVFHLRWDQRHDHNECFKLQSPCFL